MSKSFEQIAGVEIETQRERYDTRPMVTVHRLGSPERLFFTPDEARRFGAAMVAAADEVDKP